MKIHTMSLAAKGLATAALALMIPSLGWAADHILIVKTTGGTSVTTTNGVVTSAGSVTTPITIAVTGVNGGAAVTYGTGQSLVVQTLAVKMCKPGTGGNLEWLDQGLSVIGATGTLNSATPTNNNGNFIYRLVLSQTGLVNNYSTSNGSCSPIGSLSYSVTRTAVIESRNGNSNNFNSQFTGTFSFGDAVGSVPEPGTLTLIGLGLAGLGWMGAKRTRKARANTL